ncbi:arrestin domain-containing protein 5-like [Crassostrea virginica]
MSVVGKFKIVLGKSPAVFFPGQSIEGVVQFSTDRKIDTTGVYIELTGVTYVNFKEKIDRNKGGEQRYTSLDKHCHSTIALASKGGTEFCLSAGTYQYHFTTQLPEELPTSFECENGYIRYYLRAYIVLPAQDNPDCLLPFTIVTFFNLNESNYAKRSEEAEDVQTVGCCKEYVRVNLKTSKSGYVPGEIIQLEAAIDNQTQGVLNQAWVSLVMNTALRTKDKDLLTEEVIRNWPVQEIPANSTSTLNDIELVVPPLPSSGSRFCNNIDIHYSLKLCVQLTSHSYCTASVDLLIGNVPLYGCHSNFREFNKPCDIKDTINISDVPTQDLFENDQVVPVFKCEDRFIVTVDNYFVFPESKNQWNSMPLQCGKMKWSPIYMSYVKMANKDL